MITRLLLNIFSWYRNNETSDKVMAPMLIKNQQKYDQP